LPTQFGLYRAVVLRTLVPAVENPLRRTLPAGIISHHQHPIGNDAIAATSLSLLERLRRRPDAASWQRFVDLYGPLLSGWLRRLGVRPQDAEDLVQEVLGMVVRELPGFEHNQRPGAFRAWLRASLLNRLRAFWRARRSRPIALGGGAADSELNELEDPEARLSRLWEEQHDRHVLRRLLELVEPEFAPATWQAFRRVTLGGEPAAAVARELGLSVNAVWLAKSHVLRRLRQESRALLD
jgi:RNA polymerase sigma-70 factor, ECF subfamily